MFEVLVTVNVRYHDTIRKLQHDKVAELRNSNPPADTVFMVDTPLFYVAIKDFIGPILTFDSWVAEIQNGYLPGRHLTFEEIVDKSLGIGQ